MNVSGCQLIISVIFLLSLKCGHCRLHGAIVGLQINIPCDNADFVATDVRSPPFWIINGTVYELFSIPRHFPFIPVVTGFISLNIPLVSSALNGTTFQCARFGENGMKNGTVIQLLVHGGNTNGSILFRSIVELVINYQNLYTALQDSKATVSWVLNDTCSERFQVQGYTLDTGEPVLSPEHVFDIENSTSMVLPLDSNISFKLVAFGENASLCSSNRDVYYKLGVSSIESRSLNSTQCFNIPSTTLCTGGSLNFIWPARAEGRSCVCPVHYSSAGRWVFESCVEGCRDAVLTPSLTEEGEICIYNLTSSLNGPSFYFVCSTEECGGGNSCFLQTIIFSFIIIEDNLNSSSSTAAEDTTNETATENTSENTSFSIATTIMAPLLAFFLMMLLAVFLICYYYYRRKQCGTITLTTKKQKSGGIKRVAYNTNYAVASPQVTLFTVTESYDSITEQPDTVYDIPEKRNGSVVRTSSPKPQQTRGAENLPTLHQRINDGMYDVIPGETRCLFEYTSSEIRTTTGQESSSSLPQESHDELYDIIPEDTRGLSSAKLQQIQTTTGNENPPSLPKRNHDGLYDVIPGDHEASTDFDDGDCQSTYNHLIYKPPTRCAITTPDQGQCDKIQESRCLEKNISSSQNETEPTYSTLGDEQKVTEHLYSVVNKAAKKKHQLVVESDEENEMEMTNCEVNRGKSDLKSL